MPGMNVLRMGVAVLSLLLAVGSSEAAWPLAEFNPQPLADDVILPMPCGGAMAFRKVIVPAEGPLADRQIRVGDNDPDHGYAEGSRPAYIAGNFAEGKAGRYYLLGKYEVSQLQYRALSAPSCPQPAADLRLPQTDVSWVDAVVFADRYNSWLRHNALDKLPKEEAEAGYVRLPTEVEWEFAARGGIAVSDAEFADRTFPMADGMAGYVWFAGPQSANGRTQRIGLLKADPLGLHDMLGNADEMVFEPFRLNKLDRLHGAAGGFIVRGGNFLTPEADMRAAYRLEVPFYLGTEPRRSKTTGFRLALAAPMITSRQRLQAIEQAWSTLGGVPPSPSGEKPAVPALGDKPLDDPIKELGVIADAAAEANMKKRLQGLQLAFRASFQAQEEQQGRAAKARLRLGTFLCQKLKDDGVPIDRLKDVYKTCVDARGADNERCREQKLRIDEEENRQWENVRYYADTLVGLDQDYSDSVLDEQLAVLTAELNAGGVQPLIKTAALYREHARRYRKGAVIARAEWLAQCKSH